MAFITRNASITMLFVIVASLAFLIGTTVYYQVSLLGINAKYETQVATIKDMEQKASQTTSELNKAIQERELRLARGSKFATTYGQLKSEQETAEARRDRLIQEKSDLEAAILGSQREFVDAKAENVRLEAENHKLLAVENNLIEDRARKENLLRSLERELDGLKEQLEKLKS